MYFNVLLVLFILLFVLRKYFNFGSAIFLNNKTILFYHDILNEDVEYYRLLSANGRKRFIQRLHTFKSKKEFVAKGEFLLEEKHKVLVSSAAIQITFWLDDFELNHFETIGIFPSKFKLYAHQQTYKGLTGQQGTIYLSWEDFVAGYRTKEDKMNLGLHEMAHALELNAILGANTSMDFAIHYDEWKKVSMPEYERLSNNEESFLRSYAGASEREFFAVCIEYFFEDPADFKQKLPEIYTHMKILLNQDSENSREDYILT